ncbi:hypothetical protein CsSME_00050664 [Camellia sinensis var. sinensis]
MAEKTDNAKSTLFRSNAADIIEQQSEPLTTPPPPLGFEFSAIKSKASFACFDAEIRSSKSSSSSSLNNSEGSATSFWLSLSEALVLKNLLEAEKDCGLDMEVVVLNMRKKRETKAREPWRPQVQSHNLLCFAC